MGEILLGSLKIDAITFTPSLMALVLSSAVTADSSVYVGVRAHARAVGWMTCVGSGPPGVNVLLIQGRCGDQAAPSHNSRANGQKAPVIKKYNSVITQYRTYIIYL